jgi:nicotinamidase-related amidase
VSGRIGSHYNRLMANAAKLIDPRSTALVVIDLQEKLVPAIDGGAGILANTGKLIHLAKILDLKTIVTTQYRKGLGGIVSAIEEALAGAGSLDKVCFGCLGDEAFRSTLSQTIAPGGTLLLAGVESHICVMQTALGALDDGYNVHVVSDAIGSRSPANRALGIERMRDAGAIITSTEMAIYELLGNSSRPEFKQMLPYLK